MRKSIQIYFARLREQLWFKPLLFSLFSVFAALLAHQADGIGINDLVPNIDTESIGGLLDTISSSMLVISIFAVASMIAAFSSASSTATPRSFKIIVRDDVSQNALSVFIGAFIFSIVATIALDNGYYDTAGKFILLILTLILFAFVILTFLGWVQRISRLGRLEHTIEQVEAVVTKTLATYIENPCLHARPLKGNFQKGGEVYADAVGYVQNVNLEALQSLADEMNIQIRLNCLPGKFVNRNYALAQFTSPPDNDVAELQKSICKCINIGTTRLFDEDPRFGLIALTEIASRALSPGINDPGTAIQIIGSHERLFSLWQTRVEKMNNADVIYNRIEVPEILMEDFFEDAFRPIARDGADNIEVMLRLQQAFSSIAALEYPPIKEVASRHSEVAYRRAEKAINFEADLETLLEQSYFKMSK